MADPMIVGPATLAATQGFTAFSQFLPRLGEVRRANKDENPDIAADVRLGEIAAVGVTLGTGAIVSSLTQSNVPIIVAALVCAGFVILYEMTLASYRPFEVKELSNGESATA